MSARLPERVLGGDAAEGSNLAFALWVLPARVRGDMRIFYAFCRLVDDLADEDNAPVGARREQLVAWIKALEANAPNLPSDLRGVFERHAVEPALAAEIVRGVLGDLDMVRFESFEELRGYCWRVASAVGLVSARIFGCPPPTADAYAEALGIALQLTNILRDVREDAARGRLYLPMRDFADAGVEPEQVLRLESPPGLRAVLERTASRAYLHFAAARKHFPATHRRELAAAELMRALYQRLLKTMRRDGFQVMNKRYRVAAAVKCALLLKARFAP